ncbi:hypothetical protein [Photorhabdus laumondii]|uniref:Photorhabdus luminescens subsp. laumondii TTO1 complete genome segment 15/17 n=1 Tax=Photorhabdus laumondii subsp. laumondii (strain DSM 15139 / CIP 105565 / TT01) TaxID=243265 RepID=Q7MZR0_PHOLL|nr:hypothetical protein [Photorhabdus laumondii]AWK43786.1 hypothetical protein A4R40_20905 [Photorhabdus laumondii subsp. laumondii]AXG49094.1 hypothetical protein PluTT01m_21550 [Photorhabdus laumondii subsp. laumondii]CAE16589.1 unnamed protein product [Photorhabdus laumondii subsp. laumondii TTO1]
MTQIYKMVWIGFVINLSTCLLLLVVITGFDFNYLGLSYRERSFLDKILIFMLIFIFLEVANLLVILKMPRYAKISSFITSCFFPLNSAVYFIRERYRDSAWIWSFGAILLLIRGASGICIMMAAERYLSYRKTKDRYFFAEKPGGFLLTLTPLSKTIFLPYECVKRVEERENSVLITVDLNKKIDIVCSKKFIDSDDRKKVIKTLLQTALNNQGDNIMALKM